MEETTVFINLETLDLARVYLFGGVKYLDLLLVLSILDVITGVIKAWKFKKLRSRSAWFGYVRKMLSFLVVIVANEGLSITENLAQIGVKIPAAITDRLHVIEEENEQTKEKDEQAAG